MCFIIEVIYFVFVQPLKHSRRRAKPLRLQSERYRRQLRTPAVFLLFLDTEPVFVRRAVCACDEEETLLLSHRIQSSEGYTRSG